MSARAIARELEAQKLPTPKVGAWHAATVLYGSSKTEFPLCAFHFVFHRFGPFTVAGKNPGRLRRDRKSLLNRPLFHEFNFKLSVAFP
jgi:hypothetical protein